MALEQKITVKLAQKLIMTPSLQQAIKLLQMSKLELQEEIKERLHQSLAITEANGETRSAQEVAAKLGLEW